MPGKFDNNNMCINRNVCNDIRGYGLNLKTITVIDSTYSVLTDDNVIFANASGGQVNVRLLRGVKYPFPIFMIKKLDNSANVVRILTGDLGTTVGSGVFSALAKPAAVAEFISDSPNGDWKLLTHDLTIGLGLMTNKGDILSHNGTSLEVIPVGYDGDVLSADSSTSTGLKWVNMSIQHITEYPLVINKINSIDDSDWTSVANFPWLDSQYSSYTSGQIIFRVTIYNRNLDIRVRDITNATTLGQVLGVSATGSYSVAVTNPTSDAEVHLQIKKSSSGGISPDLLGVILEFTT